MVFVQDLRLHPAFALYYLAYLPEGREGQRCDGLLPKMEKRHRKITEKAQQTGAMVGGV